MRRLFLAALALAAAAGSQAGAQETGGLLPDPGPAAGGPGPEAGGALLGPSGPLLSATVSQSFTADSNLGLDDPNPGTSYYADTGLLLGFQTQTQTQAFALGLDTGLRALWEAEEDFDLTFASPSTLSADYAYDWARGALETFLRYRQRELTSATIEFDIDPDTGAVSDLTLNERDATERRYEAGVALALATDSPSSYQLNFDANRFDYSGETGGATPRRTIEGDALWRLQFAPLIAGTLGAAFSDFRAENPRETEIRQNEVDAGLIYEPSEVFELSFGIGYATYVREEDDAAGRRRTLDDENGYVVRGGLAYAFEDVTLSATARVTNAAPETRLSADVRASYPLPNGALRGRIFRRFSGGEEGDEVQVTGATIGLDHEINTVSQLGFDVALARQENLDTDEPDTDRLSFTAAYSYDFTEAVSANVGYRFSRLEEEPDSATSNAVFFEIGRTFETRP